MADAPTCNALATPAKDAGNSSFAAGRFQEAYDYYSQAIMADPDSALLRSNRSGALAALGRYVEALADADKCCQLRPDWYKSHVRRGHAMFQLNRVTDAEARNGTDLGHFLANGPVRCPACDSEMEIRTLSEPASSLGKGTAKGKSTAKGKDGKGPAGAETEPDTQPQVESETGSTIPDQEHTLPPSLTK
ncbi:unnamed protein product [Cladocopium goreaui]|uniref:Hsp70-Hsp90 organising protein (PfHOP) (Stress-inducible protein 1) n=1 Tax=Cladocopium goreaui TaxID=2562237 RepID=A0A9P1DIX1_9DINO|nr:unnamed protein product [Cladocopium goreaui]